ncbi:carbohydrate-binding domain-containing protein, partial [bacterium]|nr:carbohydrate-binding domain-containing protein [bacterium]
MFRRIPPLFPAFAILLFLILSCEKDSDPASPADEPSGTDTSTGAYDSGDFSTTVLDALAEDDDDHEDSGDYVWDPSEIIQISLNGSTIDVDGDGAMVEGSRVTITSVGNYSISGTLDDGQIIVNTQDEGIVRLILQGARISCFTGAPILIAGADKAIIVLADNTENHVTDGPSYVLEAG